MRAFKRPRDYRSFSKELLILISKVGHSDIMIILIFALRKYLKSVLYVKKLPSHIF